jgi:ATP-dependent DNA helicase DinG
MGRRCPTFDKCFYQAARRRMENGQLLITNHALFFADLAMRSRAGTSGGVLPNYHHVILDEAHEIEDVAAENFGIRLSESGVRHLLRTRSAACATARARPTGSSTRSGAGTTSTASPRAACASRAR